MRSVSKTMSAALLAALAACTATVDNRQVVDDPELGVTGEVAPRAEARKPAELGALVDTVVEPDAVTLTYQSFAPDFAVGDVILGEEGPGYLRRVVGVEVDGATVRLATVNAELAEAFESVDLEAPAVNLIPDAPVRVPATDTTTTLVADDGTVYTAHIEYGEAQTARAASVDFAWEFPDLKVVLEDPSGHVAFTLSAQKLRVQKKLTLDFGVHWKVFKLDDMRFIVDDDTTYSIDRFSVQVDGHLPKFSQQIPLIESPVLATVPIGPFVFTIGGGVGLGVDALLSAAVELHTTSDVSLTTHSRRGVTFDGTMHPINEGDVVVDADVGGIEVGRADATLDASVFVTGHVNFALYGVIGPELYGQIAPVVAKLNVGIAGWNLALSVRASGGLKFTLPILKVDPLNFDFGTFQKQYYQTSGTF
jgi:hypothetical protein